MSSFIEKYSITNRKLESSNIMKKYPNRIPIIVEKQKNYNIPDFRSKYLVSKDITLGQFLHILRKRITLKPDQNLFLFINNELSSTNELLESIYEKQKNEDGFLYCTISLESTFG